LAYDRTHLANERTYAAWLRTGLSVAAGGIAVAHLVPEPSRDSLMALGLGASFVVLGVGVMGYGARQFAMMTSALSEENPRPAPMSGRAVYILTALISVLLLAVLIFLWSHRGRTTVAAGDGRSDRWSMAPARSLERPGLARLSMPASTAWFHHTTRFAGSLRAFVVRRRAPT
jgi:putative membrane protein